MNPTTTRPLYPSMPHRRGPGRLLWPLLWLLLLIYIINNPTEAATHTRNLLLWLQTGTESIVSFFEQIAHTP